MGSAWSLLATAARNSDSELKLQIRPAYGFQPGLTGCVTLNSSLNLSACSSIKRGQGPLYGATATTECSHALRPLSMELSRRVALDS